MDIKLNGNTISEIRKLLQDPSLEPYLREARKMDQQVAARNLRNEVNANWLESFMQRMVLNQEPAHLINEATGKPHTVESLVSQYQDKVGISAFAEKEYDEVFMDNLQEQEGTDELDDLTPAAKKQLFEEVATDWDEQEHKPTQEYFEEHQAASIPLSLKTAQSELPIPLSSKQARKKDPEHGIEDLPVQKKKEKPQRDEAEEAWLINDMVQQIRDHLGSHRGYADTPAIIYNLRETFGEDVVQEYRDRVMQEIQNLKDTYVKQAPTNRLPHAPKGQPIKVDFYNADDNDIFKNIKERGGS